MSDPRLSRWLELSRRALALSSVEQLAGLGALCAERAELEASLRAAPSAGAVPRELVFELERAEAELSRALLELRADLGRRIEALRRARRATRGYEPGASSTPAFVSRSV